MLKTTDVLPSYIAGQPITMRTTIGLTEKYQGEQVAEIGVAGEPEVERAIGSAQETRRALQNTSAHERASILHTLGEGVARDAELFANDLVLDVGKTIGEARGEVARAVELLRIAAEEAVRFHGEFLDLAGSPRGGGYQAIVRRFPIGVCGLIVPFNFPLNLAIHKIAPAIATGCPWVLKPDTQACLAVLRFAGLLETTTLLRESWSVCCIEGSAREMLSEDERIALLSFTGSPVVGWALKAKAGRKKVHLELGGNAACIIDEGVDAGLVAQRIRVGGYGTAGQSCISTQRVYALPGIYETLRTKLVEEVSSLKMGDPMDGTTDVGPMFRESEVVRVAEWVREAVEGGAAVLVGGEVEGRFMQPTLLEDVAEDTKASRKEIFGPVVYVKRVESFEKAIELANDSDFGLQAGVFTNDLRRAFEAFGALEVGSVNINDVPSMRLDGMPYGGVKQSGLGREGPREAMLEMTESRQMLLAGM